MSAYAIQGLNKDFFTSIKKGEVSSYEDWGKFGYNQDIDIGTETVWAYGGTWTPQTVARTYSIVSSDAADTSAGTGARQITIYGVDANRAQQTVVVTMNGITPVVTTETWLGVNRALVTSAGSGKTNAGNITITAVTDNTVQGYIVAGVSTTQQLLFHVPSTHDAYVYHISIEVDRVSGGGSPIGIIKGYYVNNGVRTEGLFSIVNSAALPHEDHYYYIPFKFSAGSYWWIDCTTDLANTVCRIRVEQIIVKI